MRWRRQTANRALNLDQLIELLVEGDDEVGWYVVGLDGRGYCHRLARRDTEAEAQHYLDLLSYTTVEDL